MVGISSALNPGMVRGVEGTVRACVSRLPGQNDFRNFLKGGECVEMAHLVTKFP